MSWIRKRRAVTGMLVQVFSEKTSISADDMMRIYIEPEKPLPMSDFESQYVPDEETLEDILEKLSGMTGIGDGEATRLYDREETFKQFAERLLRAGAGEEGPGDTGEERV